MTLFYCDTALLSYCRTVFVSRQKFVIRQYSKDIIMKAEVMLSRAFVRLECIDILV